MIIIRGHKHLHECAYIGDDSSEEEDEILERMMENGELTGNITFDDDGNPSNNPNHMKRHRPWVEFHHPDHQQHENNTLHHDQHVEDHVSDPKIMKTLLGYLPKTNERSGKDTNMIVEVETTTKDHIHKHRDQTVNKNEEEFLTIQETQIKKMVSEESEELFQEVLNKLKKLGPRGQQVLQKLNQQLQEHDDNEEVRNILTDVLQQEQDDQVIATKGRQWTRNRVHYEDNIEENNRKRRQISITPPLDEQLNEHDEKGDAAIEEVIILFVIRL